jgi:uncharacterized protein (DUF1778 family)
MSDTSQYPNHMPPSTTRDAKLDLRLTRKAKSTLRAAASASNRSLSDFVLESALARANEALADRREFTLNPAQWKKFLAALDAPPRPLPRLRHLLKSPSFFDASTNSK